MVAGTGKDEKKLKALIGQMRLEKNVMTAGRVGGMKKMRLFSESLATVIPSRYESWGIVSLESQACGTPVVASNIPGLRQTVISKETGFLFSDRDEFLRCCLKIIKDSRLREKMSSNAKKFAKNFSWDKLAAEQEKFYFEIVRR